MDHTQHVIVIIFQSSHVLCRWELSEPQPLTRKISCLWVAGFLVNLDDLLGDSLSSSRYNDNITMPHLQKACENEACYQPPLCIMIVNSMPKLVVVVEN
jgi:hypothetical protein